MAPEKIVNYQEQSVYTPPEDRAELVGVDIGAAVKQSGIR